MIGRRLGVAAILMVGALGAGGVQGQSPSDRFQHDKHEGLFPLCAGCHAGADPDALNATLYPPPSVCLGCHDGVTEERVDWNGPAARPSNLHYEHSTHDTSVRASGEGTLVCAGCHAPDLESRWSVTAASADSCWSCHTARTHLEGAECSTCHIPLAESGLTSESVAALPSPPDHEGRQFLLQLHGEAALAEGFDACTTCHTRDRCLACHVVETELLGRVPSAPRPLMLHAPTPDYPAPSSHEGIEFASQHRPGAETVEAECGTCHTSNDCVSCHLGPAPPAVTVLPMRETARAPGTRLERLAPMSHESPFFDVGHEASALDGQAACLTCHRDESCTACHSGPTSGGYHPAAFAARHAAEAFGATMECSSCHSTEVFCRQCHVSSGLGSTGRLGSSYHDAEPLWLLRHGQAARQTMESCAGCHQQRDCVQCHSSTGSFRVSPHGAAFDAERAWRRSSSTCRACHLGDPRERRE